MFQALCLGLAASAVGPARRLRARRVGLFHQSTGYLAQAFTLGTATVVGARPILIALACGLLATCLGACMPLLDLRRRARHRRRLRPRWRPRQSAQRRDPEQARRDRRRAAAAGERAVRARAVCGSGRMRAARVRDDPRRTDGAGRGHACRRPDRRALPAAHARARGTDRRCERPRFARWRSPLRGPSRCSGAWRSAAPAAICCGASGRSPTASPATRSCG